MTVATENPIVSNTEKIKKCIFVFEYVCVMYEKIVVVYVLPDGLFFLLILEIKNFWIQIDFLNV